MSTDDSTHRIEFSVRSDDLIRLALGGLLGSKLVWLGAIIAIALFNANRFTSLLAAKFPWPDAGYFLLVIVAQVLLLIGVLFLVTILTTVAREGWRAERIGEHRMAVTADGLVDEVNHHKREWKWPGVKHIEVTERYLIIHLNGSDSRVIPRRDFASQTEFQSFAQMLATRAASAKGDDADPVAPPVFTRGATPAKLTVFFVAFLGLVFVLESYVRHNMFKDYTEYAAYMNRWEDSQDVEDVAVEQASWIGTTGLSEQTERKLPRVLRKALGELLIDKDSLKADELTYMGVFDEGGQSVHYWRLPIRYGKSVFATVSLRRTGEPVIRLNNTGPTLIKI